MRFLIFSTILLSVCTRVHSQVVTLELHGGALTDLFTDCKPTSDSGFIAAGSSSSFSPSSDIYIVKFNKTGNVEWSRAIGGLGIDAAEAILPASDSGYFVLANSSSYGNGGYDAILMYIDTLGFLQWMANIGEQDWDFAYDMVYSPDTNLLICGSTYNLTQGGSDARLVKTDFSGNILWSKKWGGTGDEVFKSVIVTADSNIASAGNTNSVGKGLSDVLLVKWNQLGDTIFTKTFGDSLNDIANQILEHSLDSGFVFSGSTESYTPEGDLEIFLFKCTKTGDSLWQHAFGHATLPDEAMTVLEVDNYNFLVSGYTSNGAGGGDVFAYIANFGGYWTPQSASYGGTFSDKANISTRLLNGTMVLAGYSNSYGSGSSDALIIRLDSVDQSYSPATNIGSANLVGLSPVLNDLQPGLVVYPNPASQTSIIHFETASYAPLELNIFNAQGQWVYATSTNSGKHTIALNADKFAAGVYQVFLTDSNQQTLHSTRLVIIR